MVDKNNFPVIVLCSAIMQDSDLYTYMYLFYPGLFTRNGYDQNVLSFYSPPPPHPYPNRYSPP